MLRLIFLAPLIALSGCGGTECGPGTIARDGRCVPTNETVTCGTGTMLVGGECRPDGTPVVCAKGTTLANGVCVPSAEACGMGTVLDATGVCVSDGTIVCGAGTTLDETGQCVPDPNTVCQPGTRYDAASGGCVADLTCRRGEVAVGGTCLTPEEIDASMADVTESVPDRNDPGLGGTPESIPTPAIGDSTIFTGGIMTPADLDGDFEPDQDRDFWAFTAAPGDTFEIVLRSLGSTELGFVIAGPNGYRRLSPLYFQPEPSRRIVAPYAGTYTIAIAPQIEIEGVTDAGPVGGDEYGYVAVLEHEAFPAASDLALGGSVSGRLLDLSDNLHRVRAPAGTLLRIDFGAVGRDAQPAVLTFDGTGAFLEELTATPATGLVHHAATADDLLVLMDWTRLVGPGDGYSIASVEVVPDDVGAIPPDGTVTSSVVTVASGDTGYVIASVTAGQIVEVAITGGSTPPDLRVIGPDGAVANAALDTRATRFYAAIGGSYTLELVSNDMSSSDFRAAFTSITPVSVGPLDASAATATAATWLPDVAPAGRAYFVVGASEPVQLAVAALQQGNANLSLSVYDARFEVLREVLLGGTAPMLSAFLPAPGVVIVEIVDSSAVVSAVGVTIDVSTGDLPPLEVEPNGTQGQATPLSPGSPLFGEIREGDSDYFRITLLTPLGPNRLLEVRATETDETDDYTCQLRTGGGTILEEQTPRHLGCVIFAGGLGAGDYYFLLLKTSPVLRVYQVRAAIIPGVREREPNDTAPGNTIADLTGAIPTYGETALNTDVDVFTFALPGPLAADQLLTVQAATVGTRPTGTVQAVLQGPTGVDSTFAVAPVGTSIRAGAAAGEYRIRLSRTSATAAFDGHYRITIATSSVSVTEAEPNDTPAQAQALGPLPATALGSIAQPSTADDDWYSFVLPQDLLPDESLEVALHRIGAQPSETLRMSLFDAGQAFLGSSNAGDPRLVTQLGLAAGTYYVRVDGTFNTTIDTSYLLTVGVTSF